MGAPSRQNKWCRHRTPFTTDFKVCKAGVDFHAFPTRSDFMPCLGETPEATARCEKYSGWTAEEIAARESESDARFERTVVIRAAIIAEHESTGANSGEIPCPACKTGQVQWVRARINGHVHARCSTPGCASWME